MCLKFRSILTESSSEFELCRHWGALVADEFVGLVIIVSKTIEFTTLKNSISCPIIRTVNDIRHVNPSLVALL